MPSPTTPAHPRLSPFQRQNANLFSLGAVFDRDRDMAADKDLPSNPFSSGKSFSEAERPPNRRFFNVTGCAQALAVTSMLRAMPTARA